ncbi:hypothetical protein SAMN04487859_12332 [Roseovarius lutimaris]|uniref:Uncharacterized protein n=1 Tax=Roseovarius lutimaris TaxID=1005928 RepID=A0A1I5FZI3_9RHOB|nr:hypothetical protein [Roseovarius lutimaris]SFO29033.1 hypothetical protein SAMN04487859_12332 [Roseovarius lutimaris]
MTDKPDNKTMRKEIDDLAREMARADADLELFLKRRSLDPVAYYLRRRAKWDGKVGLGWKPKGVRLPPMALPSIPSPVRLGLALSKPLGRLAGALLPGTWTRRGLVRGTALALVPVSAVAWHVSNGYIETAKRNLRCSEVVAMRAEDGTILDAWPAHGTDECGEHRSHLTIPIPAGRDRTMVVEMVGTIEGAWRVKDTILAQDPKGVVRKLASMVGLLGDRGMTGPLQSTFETLAGVPGGARWYQKPVLMLAGMRYAHAHLPDDLTREAFIANHMPLVKNAGYPKAGLFGAQQLFGGMPQGLLEQCRFARAAGFSVDLQRAGRPISPNAARSWTANLGPSTVRCIKLHGRNAAEIAAAMTELRRLCGGLDICEHPPSIDAGLPKAARDREQARIDALRLPVARAFTPLARPLGGGEINPGLLQRDAWKLAGAPSSGEVLDTSIYARAQASLNQRMAKLLHEGEHLLPKGSCFTGRCGHRIDHAVVVVEHGAGGPKIRAVHMNRRGAITGTVRRDSGNGGYSAEKPRFGLASTNKAMLALVAAENEVSRLCSAPNGGSTCVGGHWIPLETALGKSVSPPFEWLVHQYPQSTKALLNGLHIRGGTVVSPAFDAAYGIGRQSAPADMITYFDALMNGASPGLSVLGQPLLEPVDLDALGFDATTRAAARELLGAPLRAEGTLAAANQMLRALGVHPELAKSGTHTEKGRNLVRTSTVSSRLPDGRVFTSFVFASVTDNSQSLGDALGHWAMAPWHAAAVTAAMASNGT